MPSMSATCIDWPGRRMCCCNDAAKGRVSISAGQRTNVRVISKRTNVIPEPLDLAVMDLSFISVKLYSAGGLSTAERRRCSRLSHQAAV